MFLFDSTRSALRFSFKHSVASTRRVLSESEFEWFLERERCLADRGTRIFTLLVLRRSRGVRSGLERLSQQLRRRVRSTDVVSALADDRLGVLLPDTGSVGARVLARWASDAARSAGLEIDRKVYVYPRAPRSQSQLLPGPGRRIVRRIDRRIDRQVDRTDTDGPGAEIPEDLWPDLTRSSPPWKRAMDVLLSAAALIVLLPVFAAVAIAIRLDSPGPVIFTQQRAGRGGRPFAFYKFRSMFVDAEQRKANLQFLNEKVGPIFKIRKDPRITRVGKVLRHWSLDELPQLWNVLRGDFSLVGPRPPTLDEVERYERWHLRRLDVAGGITGIWQVSGRSEVGYWMRMDMQYVAQRGPWLDLRLLLRSVPAVLSGRGAY